MRKALIFVLVAFLITFISSAQPGNGNANGHGNGNGSGNCGRPPCGGPNQVPLDAEWLLIAGIIGGTFLSVRRKQNLKP